MYIAVPFSEFRDVGWGDGFSGSEWVCVDEDSQAEKACS